MSQSPRPISINGTRLPRQVMTYDKRGLSELQAMANEDQIRFLNAFR
jgi:hypothetical protein